MPFVIDELVMQGKRLPNIEEYGGLLLSMDSDDDYGWINDSGCVTDPSLDLLMAVQTSPEHFRFMPGTEFSPRLYRGETEYHAQCVPSISRGLCDNEALYWVGKWVELSASRIGGLTFGLSIEAIAQHYAKSWGRCEVSEETSLTSQPTLLIATPIKVIIPGRVAVIHTTSPFKKNNPAPSPNPFPT